MFFRKIYDSNFSSSATQYQRMQKKTRTKYQLADLYIYSKVNAVKLLRDLKTHEKSIEKRT